MTTELDINGYGVFGSIDSLKKAIQQRAVEGKPLRGEAEIYMGAIVIQEKGSLRLADPSRDYPHMTARVGLTGKFIIKYENNDFQGILPDLWEVVENP